MRVIVCGGRDYADHERVGEILDRLDEMYEDVMIVHGNAPGADQLAEAMWFGEVERHPADWEAYGRAAGPIRNKQMLEAGADLVIAFPGGRGTADMVKRARDAGVVVVEVDRE